MNKTLWCVTDPKPTSTLADCLFETSTGDFILQVRGGLGHEEHPELHATKGAALADLHARIGRGMARLEALATIVEEEMDETEAPE